MPQNKTKITLIVIIILNVIFVGIFIVMNNFIVNKATDTADKEDQVKTEINKKDTLSFMTKDIDDGIEFQNEINQYLVSADGTVDFLKTLENLAATSSVKSEVESMGTTSTADLDRIGMEQLDINVRLTGSWKNLQLYLKLLENYPLKINIKNVSMNMFSTYQVKGKNIPQWDCGIEFTVLKIKSS